MKKTRKNSLFFQRNLCQSMLVKVVTRRKGVKQTAGKSLLWKRQKESKNNYQSNKKEEIEWLDC